MQATSVHEAIQIMQDGTLAEILRLLQSNNSKRNLPTTPSEEANNL